MSKQAPLSGARLSEEARSVIAALVFLEGHKSMQSLLEPVLEAYASERKMEPEVQEALKLADRLQQRQAKEAGKVADLDKQRKRRKQKN